MAIINISNAQIKTAAVEIKTLTVSGRQVTLSVFKQIIEEPLLDEVAMKLNGTPWGTVNYFVKDDLSEFKINIIWQKGSELRRCAIFKKPYVMACRLIGTEIYNDLNDKWNEVNRKIKDLETINYDVRMIENNINTESNIRPLLGLVERCKTDLIYYEKTESEHAGHLKKCIELANERLNFLYEKLNNYKLKMHEFESKTTLYVSQYTKLVEPLLALPHLFIAI